MHHDALHTKKAPAPPVAKAVPILTTFGGVLIVAATFYGAVHFVSPFYSHMYPFAWYGLILFLDGLLWWKWNESLIFQRPREFLVLCFWSSVFWFFFEVWNLRLQNWYFVGAPRGMWGHLEAYIDFATVLPGMFLIYRLLCKLGVPPQRTMRAFPPARKATPWVLIGTVMLVLPLAFPDTFFFCVWGFLIFLLEPLLTRSEGTRSLFQHAATGDWTPMFRLLTAGLLSGFYWELCNFWALEKWVYTVPFFSEGKLFEMPYLGFLGFPPFCVECFVMTNGLYLLRNGRHWMPEWNRPHRTTPFRTTTYLVLSAAALFFAEWAYDRMQYHTVESHAETVEMALEDIDASLAQRLADQGWTYPEQARRHWEAVERAVPESFRRRVRDRLDLVTLLHIGSINARLLEAAGIRNRQGLADADADRLYRKLVQADEALDLRDAPILKRRVISWIGAAKRHSPLH